MPADFQISLVNHALLLILTFGVYGLVWVYKTTKKLNLLPGSDQRNPVTKLLLLMFVPFYFIYWFYQSAQIVDDFGERLNEHSQISLAVLLVSLLAVPISFLVVPILIQNKMNRLYLISNSPRI